MDPNNNYAILSILTNNKDSKTKLYELLMAIFLPDFVRYLLSFKTDVVNFLNKYINYIFKIHYYTCSISSIDNPHVVSKLLKYIKNSQFYHKNYYNNCSSMIPELPNWTLINDNVEMYISTDKKNKTEPVKYPSSSYTQYGNVQSGNDIIGSGSSGNMNVYHFRSTNTLNIENLFKDIALINDTTLKNKFYYQIYIHVNGCQKLIKYEIICELTNNRTFKSLFVKNKPQVIDLINNFKQKNGIYKIEGISHKLGFLLHGPPGTGKTTFIKTLANELDRSIVSIPLQSIKTNKELSDIFNKSEKCIKNEVGFENYQKLEFKDVIYIIEDIDAIGSIVSNRTKDGGGESGGSRKIDENIINNLQTNFKLQLANVCKTNGLNGADLTELEEYDTNDELTLAGILNVIDGIADCQNRIIIFTTNHPEVLDPALIRPGRIDYIINLSYLDFPTALEMLNHFHSVNDNEVERFKILFEKYTKITPASLENYIRKYNNIEQLLLFMENENIEEYQ